MTTPRTRRTKPQQVRDLLQALLKEQMAKADRHKAKYESAQNEASKTRRALEALEVEPTLTPITVKLVEIESGTFEAKEETLKRPHGQRVGEKALSNDPERDPPMTETEAKRNIPPRKFVSKVHLPFQRIGEKAPSGCAHPQTGIVDGVRRCFICDERVFDMATKDFGKGEA